jgi:hypothetical protein
MANVFPASLNNFGQHLLMLPRELRDLIYFYIVVDDSPLDITKTDVQVPLDHTTISTEWLEAIYTHRVCSITIPDSKRICNRTDQPSIWGTHPHYGRFIRRIIVYATESSTYENDLETLEHDCSNVEPEVQQEWMELSRLPHLERLTINLQKRHPSVFSWSNFSPVVYQLREQKPKIHIELHVSFDALLKEKWDHGLSLNMEFLGWNPGDNDPYLPMGFVNLSELIEPPTDEDRKYVEEHLPGKTAVGSRDALRGLLDETPANRRLLAQYYVVKEPALLRVLMAEHYKIHELARKEGKNGGQSS